MACRFDSGLRHHYKTHKKLKPSMGAASQSISLRRVWSWLSSITVPDFGTRYLNANPSWRHFHWYKGFGVKCMTELISLKGKQTPYSPLLLLS
jgi:hypothetical protein